MNAHAGMPFFGVSRFVVLADKLVIGNSPFGAWVVCVYRVKASLEPRMDKCIDLRLFCFHTKSAQFFVEQGKHQT